MNVAARLSLCVLFAGAMLAAGCDQSPPNQNVPEDQLVLDVLHEQEAAWNRGDLSGFMQGYWPSDSLRFASGGTVRYGWQTTLDGYKQGYPDADAMGTLSFDSLSINFLGADDAYVFGRWALARDTTFAPASGLFTLILHRTPQGWRIVHDHTSAAR